MKFLAHFSCLFLILTHASLAQAAYFQGLGTGPGSFATAVSADGRTVVGNAFDASGSWDAFRWTIDGGLESLGDLPGGSSYCRAYDVSADGSTVVGDSGSASGTEAFRWTSDGGMEGLGDLPGGASYSRAYGVSADGSMVVGHGLGASGTEGFRWTSGGGMEGLGDLLGGDFGSHAWGVSADASTIVGDSEHGVGRVPVRWSGAVGSNFIQALHIWGSGYEARRASADGSTIVGVGAGQAFVWTSETGLVLLGFLPRDGYARSAAWGVSADGSTVVGSSRTKRGDKAFIWDETNGMREVEDVLKKLGVKLNGWMLTEAFDISDDGKVIVGGGTNPNGDAEAWMAILPVSGAGSFDAELSGINSIWDVESQDYGSSANECDFDPVMGQLCLDVTTTTPVIVDSKGRISGTASVEMKVTLNGELIVDGSVSGPLKGKLKGKDGVTKFGMKFKGKGTMANVGPFADTPVTASASSVTKGIVDSSGDCSSSTYAKISSKVGYAEGEMDPVFANLGDGSWELSLDVDADDRGKLAGTATAETALGDIDYWVSGKHDPKKGESQFKLTPVSGIGGKIQIKGLRPGNEPDETPGAEIKYKIDGYQGKALELFEVE